MTSCGSFTPLLTGGNPDSALFASTSNAVGVYNIQGNVCHVSFKLTIVGYGVADYSGQDFLFILPVKSSCKTEQGISNLRLKLGTLPLTKPNTCFSSIPFPGQTYTVVGPQVITFTGNCIFVPWSSSFTSFTGAGDVWSCSFSYLLS